MKDVVGIMARFPVPGQAKTRLAAALGPTGAATFYNVCARLVFREIAQLPAGVKKYIFVTGAGSIRNITKWAGSGYIARRQAGDGLGDRLQHAFEYLFTHKANRAIIVASDVPDISANLVIKALIALQSHDIVLGPSHDGGYYLIGMCKPHPVLFQGITWGSAEVLAQTLAAIETSHLSLHMMPTLIDIDTFDDYRLWQANRRRPVRITDGSPDIRDSDRPGIKKE